MKQRHPQARQKMSRVIDEIGAALFACGATEVSLRLKKNRKDCAFWFRGIILLKTARSSSGCPSSCSPRFATRRWPRRFGSWQAQTWRMTHRSLPSWGRF